MINFFYRYTFSIFHNQSEDWHSIPLAVLYDKDFEEQFRLGHCVAIIAKKEHQEKEKQEIKEIQKEKRYAQYVELKKEFEG